MIPRTGAPYRAGVRVFGLAAVVVAAVGIATAQGPEPQAPAAPDCSTIDARHLDMQMNIHASAVLVACGREVAGGEAAELGVERDPDAGTILKGANVDLSLIHI